MPFWRFTILTLLGCIPWVLMLGVHRPARSATSWEEWRDYLHYGDYVVLAAVVGGVIWLLIRRRRGGGGDPRAGRGRA